jgi:hypothetical protein
MFMYTPPAIECLQEQELAQRAATLQQLAPSLAGKVVVDCTNIGYLVGEEAWGQTSSLLLNMAAAGGVDIKWACAWKHVPWVSAVPVLSSGLAYRWNKIVPCTLHRL